MKIESVGLIGVGRFGTMAYRHLKDRVVLRLYDVDVERVREFPESCPLEEVCRSQVILLSVPISSISPICRRIAPLLGEGQTVIDTCSVKSRPVQWMVDNLPANVEILGTHPLFGPDSGKDGIGGLKIAVCPVRIAPERFREIWGFLQRLGLVVIEATPEEHDRQIALSQAIFHLIAQAMGRLDWGAKPISTPGPDAFYRLVKTVQKDTSRLFRDMERENPYAAECRKTFIDEILAIDRELRAQTENEQD